jgi:hypothetical protein
VPKKMAPSSKRPCCAIYCILRVNVSHDQNDIFRDEMPIWEGRGVFRGVCLSVVPTGLGSICRGIPRTYVLGCNMPPLRGWGLPARSAVSDKCEFSGRALIRERRIRCLRIVISVTSFLQWPVPQSFSREAATECSPGRKPWVKAESGASPKGRKKRGPDLRQSRCAPDLQHQTT